MATGLERTAVSPHTMQAGQAARQPVGMQSTASPPMSTLLQQASASPQFYDLFDYLRGRQMVPNLEYRGILDDPLIRGRFSYDYQRRNAAADPGVVELTPNARPNTVVHELTHAAQRQLTKQYNELIKKDSLLPEEQQFVDGYQKLIFTPGEAYGRRAYSAQRATAEKIAPEWSKKQSDYRSTGGELAAFGMGSTVERNDYAAPLHVDPTYATEFSVLLDLAKRLQRKKDKR
jgi:hypothetical protein